MGDIVKHIQARQQAPLISGLALLWFSFHASPYYPFSLSTAFSGQDVGVVSAQHIAYTIAFVMALAGAYLIHTRRKDCKGTLLRTFVVACIAGFAGCAAQIVDPLPTEMGQLALGISLAFVAIYAAMACVSWFSLASCASAKSTACSIVLSYVVFGVAWAALLALGDFALKCFIAVCPLLAIPCFAAAQKRTARSLGGQEGRALSALPWNIISLCLVFVYFGVVAVRAFTTMGTGTFSIGSLGTAPQIITALTGAAICGALAWVFSSKEPSPSTFITAFATLALVYMAALLVVTLGDQTQSITLAGKRMLVAAEHSVEVLLAAILACEASRRNISSALLFSMYGATVLAIPQFITLDVMYQSGLFESIAGLSLVTPAAAIGAFLIAAAAIVALVRFSARTATDASVQGDTWQEGLCREALAGHDVTPREFDVVLYTYRGYSAKHIAEELLVSQSTVKAHLSHAYRKLGVHSKQELIALIDEYRSK